jgi:hypothetical protein
MRFKTFRCLAVFAWIPVTALAVTVHIPYIGGKQSDSFEIKGAYSLGMVPGASFPDTVVLDGALRITAFTEESYAGKMGLAGYWLFLENSRGPVGFRNSTDTVWSETTTFPSTSLRLDSIAPFQDPLGRFYPANLTATRLGVKARKVDFGYEGVNWAYTVERVGGDNRTVYFRFDTPQGVRYGKIRVSRDSVYTGVNPIVGGNKQLASLTVQYLMFSAAEYDATPMGLQPRVPGERAPAARLVWSEREGLRLRDAQGGVYNLHGRRVPEARP